MVDTNGSTRSQESFVTSQDFAFAIAPPDSKQCTGRAHHLFTDKFKVAHRARPDDGDASVGEAPRAADLWLIDDSIVNLTWLPDAITLAP